MRFSHPLYVSLVLALLLCLPTMAKPAGDDDAAVALAAVFVDEDAIRSVSQAMYARNALDEMTPELLEQLHDGLDFGGLKSNLAEILRQHLTPKEIRAHLAFLETSAGTKMRQHEQVAAEALVMEILQWLTPPVEALNDQLGSPALNVSSLLSALLLEGEVFDSSGETTPERLQRWLEAKGPDQSPEIWRAILDDMDFEVFAGRLEEVFEIPLTPQEQKVYDDFESSKIGRRINNKLPALTADIQDATQQWMQASLETVKQLLRSGELTTPSLTRSRGLRDTVRSVREVGDAMVEWIMDTVLNPSDTPPVPDDGEEEAWQVRQEGKKAQVYRRISHDQLTHLLVPKYLQEVPSTDGWGHAFEFAVNTDLMETTVLSIRSPGQDGQFDTESYLIGPFSMDEADHDIVWTDGYFSRWPDADTPPHAILKADP